MTERTGRFELADGGTLFFDEVGEPPLHLQAKLLRVLQDGEIQRLGSDRPVAVDVRIIAATNRNLETEVEQGRFRADLYHRLSVFPVRVPPLRERGSDVLALAECFLEQDQHRLNLQKIILSEDARIALLRYKWPGNVRELGHVLSRAALRASRARSGSGFIHIGSCDLGLDAVENGSPDHEFEMYGSRDQHVSPVIGPLNELTKRYQSLLIQSALEVHNGNVSAAARALCIDRSNLLRLMKRLEVSVR